MRTRKKGALGLENYSHPDHFGKWLGYRIKKFDRKRFVAVTELRIRPDHLSPSGRVHGGVISSFFDYSCGAAVFASLKPRDYTSTVEIKVNYLRPLEQGDLLRCETRVVFRGKRLAVVHGFIYRGREREPVAMTTATFNVVSAE